MRPPPRKRWPQGLRALCRTRRGLYPKLEMMRYQAPFLIIWLNEHWATPTGVRLIDQIDSMELHAFLDLIENGGSVLNGTLKSFARDTAVKKAAPSKASKHKDVRPSRG